MSTTLKSIPATVAPDGTVTLAEPLTLGGTASAMVTIALEENTGNEIGSDAFEAAADTVFEHYDPLLKELAK